MKTLTLLFFALVSLLFLTAGCQSDAFARVVERMVTDGDLTPAQGQVVVDAWQATVGAGNEWWVTPVNILGGAILAWLGVRSPLPLIGRGSPTQKVGLPVDKVHD
ncbi:MAG: hypothetical protein H6590_06215 [Flavobacteriales bacterium]|nr:hypothetical protein [Flavobacteriales bacterium]